MHAERNGKDDAPMMVRPAIESAQNARTTHPNGVPSTITAYRRMNA